MNRIEAVIGGMKMARELTLEECKAERDRLAAELADTLVQLQNANTLLSPRLTALKLATGGFEAKIDGKGVAQVMAHAFWDLLTETQAKNYVTITFEREGREIEVIVQKREAKTAHDLRLEAEAERDRLRAELDQLRSGAVLPSPVNLTKDVADLRREMERGFRAVALTVEFARALLDERDRLLAQSAAPALDRADGGAGR